MSEAGQGTALTIAGFDPSSGAGVTADLLSFAAHGVFGTAAVTALTVQSTRGVFRVEPVLPEVLQETLLRLEEDLPPAGVKLGMLGSAAHAAVVAEYLAGVRAQRPVTVVMDPVLRSSSGASLLEGGAGVLRGLLPHVDAVTPNLVEAAALAGMPCESREEMERCGRQLCSEFAGLRVVVTGGHLPEPADLLCEPDGVRWFGGRRLETASTHGTGCAFSSALLAGRMAGRPWAEAVDGAKRFVVRGMERAVTRGMGRGPLALLPQLERDAVAAEKKAGFSAAQDDEAVLLRSK